MPDLLCLNPCHTESLLRWKKINFDKVGDLFELHDYVTHALLININKIFSQHPKFEPIDRTGHTVSPYRQHVSRPWQVPKHGWTLDQALSERVKNLSAQERKINLFWSGGIDSTTAATAFLKNLHDHSQLRVLYSPFSTYEHPDYLDFLGKFDKVELIDISGENYLHDDYDGIYITGDGGDELNASLDESFFQQVGYDGLHKNWRDLFLVDHDVDFVDRCEQFFLQAGRPIHTVLEARWWFYASCKQRSILNLRLPWFFNRQHFAPTDLVGFFDCEEYENYIFWNIAGVIDRAGYQTWKQPLKHYCFAFDGLESWYKNKTKTHSSQMSTYLAKKSALNDQRWIAIMADGSRVSTPSLPVLTRSEFVPLHRNWLDGIFNEPDKI